jgi:hypothetical protein
VTLSGVTGGATYKPGEYSASCATTDALSGVAAAATLSSSGGPTGAVTLTCSGAVDNAGNGQASAVSVTINVAGDGPPPPPPPDDGYQFSGFKWPVAAPPKVNQVRSGDVIWMKFGLGGFKGWRIYAEGYPRTWSYTCGTEPGPSPDWAPAARSAATGYWFRYDTYFFAWKTSWEYGNTCRVFEVKFRDGSSYRALFQFKSWSHHRPPRHR